MLPREAKGRRLHVTCQGGTERYTGVTRLSSGLFQAARRLHGFQHVFGQYDTMLEAAVEYARVVGDAKRPPPVREACGWQLHLNKQSQCGYLGVYQNPIGYESEYRPFHAQLKVGKKMVYLGKFCTAIEAAVAYAKAASLMEDQPTLSPKELRRQVAPAAPALGGEARPSLPAALPPPAPPFLVPVAMTSPVVVYLGSSTRPPRYSPYPMKLVPARSMQPMLKPAPAAGSALDLLAETALLRARAGGLP